MLSAVQTGGQFRLLTRVMIKRTSTSRVGREPLVMWILGSIMPLVCGSTPHTDLTQYNKSVNKRVSVTAMRTVPHQPLHLACVWA